jgi:type II secretion system (T2SS) protein E
MLFRRSAMERRPLPRAETGDARYSRVALHGEEPVARLHEGEQEGRRALTARLREHLRSTPSDNPAGAVLVMRPGGHAYACEADVPLPPLSPAALAQLTERIRVRIRGADQVITEPRFGTLAIVLYDAGAAGARAVMERLCAALESGATVSGLYPPEARLSVGYSPAGSLTPQDSARVVRVAWRMRRLITVDTSEPSLPSTRRPALDAARITPADASVTPTEHSERRVSIVALKHEPREVAGVEARPDSDALRAAARALGVPYAQIPRRLPAACRRAITPELARSLRAVPIGRTRGVLTVAMQNPSDACSVQRLHGATGLTVFPVLADADEIERALAQLAGE